MHGMSWKSWRQIGKQQQSDVQLSERLASVGIMSTIVLRGLREAINWVSIMQRGASLSDSCTFFIAVV